MNFFHDAAMRALPPFDALVAFDTALRQRSMTLAAAELGLTQSAVSHRLRRLEGFIGTPLFIRSGTGLNPTPPGLALAAGLAELLDGLADLRARCRAAAASSALRVGVGAALADHWLVRRLPAFAAAHPDIGVELSVMTSEAEARTASLDIQVLWQPVATARASTTQRLLFQEQVFPVCHPRLLPAGGPLDDPAGLKALPLLHKGEPGRNAGAEWSWASWFERLGLDGKPAVSLRFLTVGTAIAAALEGAGVVLARSLLVHDALADGRLVRVLPAQWDVPSGKAHLVRWPAALTGDPRVRHFAAWLAGEADRTMAIRRD